MHWRREAALGGGSSGLNRSRGGLAKRACRWRQVELTETPLGEPLARAQRVLLGMARSAQVTPTGLEPPVQALELASMLRTLVIVAAQSAY